MPSASKHHDLGWFGALLSAPLSRLLVQRGAPETFSRGQVIVAPSVMPRRIWFVTQGAVRVATQSSPNDSGTTVGVAGPGDVVGELALAHGRKGRTVAVALWETSALGIAVSDLESLRADHRELETALTALMADALDRCVTELARAHRWSSAQRLRMLLRELDYFTGGGPIPMTQADLATVLGVNRTTVTELLAVEVSAGRVRAGRGLLELLARGRDFRTRH